MQVTSIEKFFYLFDETGLQHAVESSLNSGMQRGSIVGCECETDGFARLLGISALPLAHGNTRLAKNFQSPRDALTVIRMQVTRRFGIHSQKPSMHIGPARLRSL